MNRRGFLARIAALIPLSAAVAVESPMAVAKVAPAPPVDPFKIESYCLNWGESLDVSGIVRLESVPRFGSLVGRVNIEEFFRYDPGRVLCESFSYEVQRNVRDARIDLHFRILSPSVAGLAWYHPADFSVLQ